MPKNATLRLAELVRDERLRYRDTRLIAPVVKRYTEAFDDYKDAGSGWGQFPPVTVMRLAEPHRWREEDADAIKRIRASGEIRVKDVPLVDREYPAGSLLLVGGFTRTEAAELAGLQECPACVYDGTWEDAHRLAWLENTRHGAARTERDTEIVLTAIHARGDHRDKSEREIAVLAGCSRSAVNRYRAEVRRQTELNQGTLPFSDKTVAKKVRDAWGREVPEPLHGEFRIRSQVLKSVEQLRKWSNALIALKYSGEQVKEPGLARVDVRDIAAELLARADQIESLIPFLVCPDCDGSGRAGKDRCELCKGEGLILQSAAVDLPPESERKARAAAGERAA